MTTKILNDDSLQFHLIRAVYVCFLLGELLFMTLLTMIIMTLEYTWEHKAYGFVKSCLSPFKTTAWPLAGQY